MTGATDDKKYIGVDYRTVSAVTVYYGCCSICIWHWLLFYLENEQRLRIIIFNAIFNEDASWITLTKLTTAK